MLNKWFVGQMIYVWVWVALSTIWLIEQQKTDIVENILFLVFLSCIFFLPFWFGTKATELKTKQKQPEAK